MKRIGDGRDSIDTREEAEALMEEIAHAECETAYSEAFRDREIMRSKRRHEKRNAKHVARLSLLVPMLRDFIAGNKRLFKSPRKIVTAFGSFGLQKVEEVVITDELACVNALEKRGLHDCLKVVRTPIKSELKKLLKAKKKIPGCRLKTGDTAVYKTDADRISDAKKRAEALP